MTALEKLQLRDSIPEDEVCHCGNGTPFFLRYAFTEFPIFCVECNGQILPENMAISEAVASALVEWRDVYAALYTLWLDSGEYEKVAKQLLVDPKGQVNVDGQDLAKRVVEGRRGVYWFFWDADDPVPNQCPCCELDLQPYTNRNFKQCRACDIAI